MNKTLLSLLSAILLFSACTKKGNNPPSSTNTNLSVLGTWQVTSDRAKAYSTSTNALIQDTTYTTFGDNNEFAWRYIFNKDGSYYVTTLPAGHGGVGVNVHPDTTSYLHYSISGKTLTYTEDGDDTKYHYTILQSTATTLELESVYTATGDSSDPKLDMNTTYKFVEDTYYTKLE